MVAAINKCPLKGTESTIDWQNISTISMATTRSMVRETYRFESRIRIPTITAYLATFAIKAPVIPIWGFN